MKFHTLALSVFGLIMMFLLLFFPKEMMAQFRIENGKKRSVVSFELVNNLVVVPVSLNGVNLSFLLDTGIKNTLLFGVTTKDSIAIKNASPIKLRGLGGTLEVTALKSMANTLRLGNAVDYKHDVFVVFDEQFDLSKRMGVPIHGIMGFEFFNDFVVKTNYTRKKLVFYDPVKFRKKKCKKCAVFDLTFFKSKPYLDVLVNGAIEPSKVLIDSGSSDALWLFDDEGYIEQSPKNYFDDFLGLSISGNIYGKRSKMKSLRMKDFMFTDLTVAFPDIQKDSITLFKNRKGSIGGEILKRFTVIMDYRNKQMTLKKNSNFKKPFYYNLSGLTLSYDGSLQIKELQDVKNESLNISRPGDNTYNGQVHILLDPVYNLLMTPKVVVAEIRDNSPAARAGLQVGDGIVKINGEYCYKYKLYELIALLSSKEGKRIKIEYEREDSFFTTVFKLEKVL